MHDPETSNQQHCTLSTCDVGMSFLVPIKAHLTAGHPYTYNEFQGTVPVMMMLRKHMIRPTHRKTEHHYHVLTPLSDCLNPHTRPYYTIFNIWRTFNL